jgi:hypothetical protein
MSKILFVEIARLNHTQAGLTPSEILPDCRFERHHVSETVFHPPVPQRCPIPGFSLRVRRRVTARPVAANVTRQLFRGLNRQRL